MIALGNEAGSGCLGVQMASSCCACSAQKLIQQAGQRCSCGPEIWNAGQGLHCLPLPRLAQWQLCKEAASTHLLTTAAVCAAADMQQEAAGTHMYSATADHTASQRLPLAAKK